MHINVSNVEPVSDLSDLVAYASAAPRWLILLQRDLINAPFQVPSPTAQE